MKPSPQQQKVIETWNQSLAVVAGAGSGKTTTVIEKCRVLLEKNPSARICAVSFTERSARDLFDRFSSFTDVYQHRVATIHGLCRSVIEDFPQKADCDGGEKILNETESKALWDQTLERLWFEAAPDKVESSLQRLLTRESRGELMNLIQRVKSLQSFGVIDALMKSKDQETYDLGVVSAHAIDFFNRSKVKQGVLDFDDLETHAKTILSFEEVRSYYHRKFDLMIVDEFQDTNPIQAQIIRSIARPGFQNLCVVGDPKQSIYRFRDADVSLFEEWCEKMQVQVSLDWNFRSHPKIIEFVNQVSERPFEASGMAYHSLVPKKEVEEESEESLERWDIQSPAEFARALKNEVERKNESYSDRVLLLKRIRGSEHWIQALSSEGIPLAIGSGGLFWEDPRVRELASFIVSWFFPQNRLSMATFLRAPWMGISDQQLDQWFTADRDLWEAFLQSFLARIVTKVIL